MPAADGPPSHSNIQSATDKLLRALLYYTALLTCVILTIGVSYTVILHLARDSVRDQTQNPDAIAEARSLNDFKRELQEIGAALDKVAKNREESSEVFSRRLNDLRRRMHRFPKDSESLNVLIRTGDYLLAWSSTPQDEAARDRAKEALLQAESAVKQRIELLNVPESMLR